MALLEKRTHELTETSDKTGKFILLDEAGLAEAVKYSADLLIDKAQTDLLYVKVAGDELVNGIKTWANLGIFNAGLEITAGDLQAININSTGLISGVNALLDSGTGADPYQLTLRAASSAGAKFAGINFSIDTSDLWRMGFDNADGNAFKLVYNNTNNYLRIASNGNSKINGSLSLEVSTTPTLFLNRTTGSPAIEFNAINEVNTKATIYGDSTTSLGAGVIRFRMQKSAGVFNDIVMDNEGALLIGTDSGVGKLTVKSAGRSTEIFNCVKSDGANVLFKVGEDASGNGFIQVGKFDNSNMVKFSSLGDSFVFGGNFGVGTKTPTEKLHVVGQMFATGGRKPAGTKLDQTGNLTENTLFDLLSPSIPADQDTMIVNGSFKSGSTFYVATYARRNGTNTIFLYGTSTAGTQFIFGIDNSSSATIPMVSLSW